MAQGADHGPRELCPAQATLAALASGEIPPNRRLRLAEGAISTGKARRGSYEPGQLRSGWVCHSNAVTVMEGP